MSTHVTSGFSQRDIVSTLDAEATEQDFLIVLVFARIGLTFLLNLKHWCLFCQYLYGIYSAKVISTEKWRLE